MANKPDNLKILIFIYTDYHLFEYFQQLIPKLLDTGHSVTLISGNAEVTDKYGVVHKHLKVKKAYYLNPFVNRMNQTFFRCLSWVLAWVWSFIQSRGCQLIIVPRTTKLLYLTLAMWKPTLVCDPGYGTEQKAYLVTKYRQKLQKKKTASSIDTYKNVPVEKNRFDYLDRILSFGNAFSAPHHYKNTASRIYYTTMGEDLVGYFTRNGVPESHVFVVGNPNYEPVSNDRNLTSNRDFYLRDIAPDSANCAVKKVFTIFLWLEQPDGLANAEKFLKAIDQLYPESFFLVKQHPDEVHGRAKSALEKKVIELTGNVIFLDPGSGNDLNRNVVAISDAVFIQSYPSSIVALAVLLGVPAIRYDFFPSGRLERWDFLAALDGWEIISTVDDLNNTLRSLEDESIKQCFKKRQAESFRKVDAQPASPCAEILSAIKTIRGL